MECYDLRCWRRVLVVEAQRQGCSQHYQRAADVVFDGAFDVRRASMEFSCGKVSAGSISERLNLHRLEIFLTKEGLLIAGR
jgi:hypothetical protein